MASLLLLAFIFFTRPIHSSEKKSAPTVREITLCSIDWPPYYGQNLVKGGFITEIIRRSLKHSSLVLKTQYLPWQRTVNFAKQGKVCSGIYTFGSKTEERKKFFHFSEPLPSLKFSVIVRKNSEIIVKNLNDLKKLRIGIVSGYTLTKEFEAVRKTLTLTEVTEDLQLIKMLISNRVNAILTDPRVFQHYGKLHFPKDLLNYGDVFLIQENSQYVGISKAAKQSQAITEALNKGIRHLNSNGDIQKIMDSPDFSH